VHKSVECANFVGENVAENEKLSGCENYCESGNKLLKIANFDRENVAKNENLSGCEILILKIVGNQ
jgi:hypothetical protein